MRGPEEGAPRRGGSSGVRRNAELLDDEWEGSPRRTGRVSAFDDDRGLGVVTGDDGAEITFHCTAIADGSRTIEVGASVSYLTRPRHLGRWEATDLRPA